MGKDSTIPNTDGMRRTIDYMHEHYGDKIKLVTLSKLAGFTPTSYSRERRHIRVALLLVCRIRTICVRSGWTPCRRSIAIAAK